MRDPETPKGMPSAKFRMTKKLYWNLIQPVNALTLLNYGSYSNARRQDKN